MNHDLWGSVSDPIELARRIGEPSRRFAALALDNAEKLIELQLQAARVYTGIGLSQLRALLDIHDAESLQRFMTDQASAAEDLVKRAAEDAETVAGIGNDFASDVARAASENLTAVRDTVTAQEPTGATPRTTDRRTAGKGSQAQSNRRATSRRSATRRPA